MKNLETPVKTGRVGRYMYVCWSEILLIWKKPLSTKGIYFFLNREVLQIPYQFLSQRHFSIMLSTLHDLPRPVDVHHKPPFRGYVRLLIVTLPFSLQAEEMSFDIHSF